MCLMDMPWVHNLGSLAEGCVIAATPTSLQVSDVFPKSD